MIGFNNNFIDNNQQLMQYVNRYRNRQKRMIMNIKVETKKRENNVIKKVNQIKEKWREKKCNMKRARRKKGIIIL
jgi:hypothetical protein